ncbi:MAG: HAD-IA family hydrolase [Bacteroidota bacterium]|jgi:putative hydrolase of the HAD superfamily|nr:HAD-IA family hydrolase [Bacteroidota bacterium]
MIDAVVFDLDNTLVDFMLMKRNAVDAGIRAMIDAGLQVSFREIDEMVSRIYKEEGIEYQRVFNRVLEELTNDVDHKVLAAGIVGYRKAREATLVPYPHVHMTLFTLARMGLKLGVVSDAPKLEAWLRLCSLNLHHIFDAVVTFEDTGERKPSPTPFQRVLSLMQVQPDQAIMVGDWEERDILGARNIGMRTAFARYGDTFNTGQSSADYDLMDIGDLIGIIRALREDAS